MGVAPVVAWLRGTCWATSGASVPVGCQGALGVPQVPGGGGLWSLLGDPVLGDSQVRPAGGGRSQGSVVGDSEG